MAYSGHKIKKYIVANYKIHVEKLGPDVRRGVVHAVEKVVLVRVGNKDKAASGCFNLGKKAAEHKPKAVKKPKVPKVKKAATPKKPKVDWIEYTGFSWG
ncbi:unnamed protein product [Echinostoma caproni]|uniref:H15 domain-containing protein n=1 Tax=Echinostoma caproni TaxID=27848 RepID=A0A183B6N9_9TREM|nr:unnamed protein product [Echinostoma caproni]